MANDEAPTVESTPEREKAVMRGGSGGDRGHHGFPPPPPSDTSSAGSPPPLQRRPRAPPPLWVDQRARNQHDVTDISDVMQNLKPCKCGLYYIYHQETKNSDYFQIPNRQMLLTIQYRVHVVQALTGSIGTIPPALKMVP